MSKKNSYSDLAIPPGEYLEEVLSELGMTKNELARRMNGTVSSVNAILTGKGTIMPDMALRLEKEVGVPGHVWIGLESDYRSALARRQKSLEKKQTQKSSL